MERLTLIRPDDWHAHLRDGPILSAVAAATARHFARAIVMPNLSPPVTTTAQAAAYRERIRAALPQGSTFEPLMTAYLTDHSDPADLAAGHASGVLTAVKLYPAGATTNSQAGVTRIDGLDRVFDKLSHIGMPLLIHAEVVDPDVDVFDREAVFIEREFVRLHQRFPELRMVFEHVTTRAGVEFIRAAGASVAGTITPHHLSTNRNALFRGGIRPHYYCLPIAKREEDRAALVQAAVGGEAKFFLGTDTAPHPRARKESDCGCAGVYNAPTALATYAQVFAAADALARLEDFASRFGPRFYGLPENTATVTLRRVAPQEPPADLTVGDDTIRIFVPEQPLEWVVEAPGD